MNSAAQAVATNCSIRRTASVYLADETGGFAFKRNERPKRRRPTVLEDQSYYLVAYEPETDTFDPAKRKFNKLSIKVLRKVRSARYRSGFFNVADKPGKDDSRNDTGRRA